MSPQQRPSPQENEPRGYEPAPWELEGRGQQRAPEEAAMIGRGVRHTPGHQAGDFSRGIDPDAWMARPGAAPETSGAGRREPARDSVGGVTVLVFGLFALGIGVAMSAIKYNEALAQPLDLTNGPAAPSTFSPWWGLAAVGLLAMLRGVQLLMRKV